MIGNPPYIDIKGMPKDDVKLYFKLFKTAENRINLYSLFIERGISILKHDGILAYINPNSILINESYKKIRKFIIEGVEKIIKLPDSVFETAIVETVILIITKQSRNENIQGIYFSKSAPIDFSQLEFKKFHRVEWLKDTEFRFNIFSNNKIDGLLAKIEENSKPLERFVLTSLGITPYDKYKGHTKDIINNRTFHSVEKLSDEYVPLISGKNIHRYFLTNEIDEYLKYGNWLGAPREKKFFDSPKIIVRQIVNGKDLSIIAAYSELPKYFTQIGFSLISKNENKSELKFLLGLINSSVISFYHRHKFLDVEKSVFQKILIANCKRLPVSIPHNTKPFITIVDKILLGKEKGEDTKSLENQIDQMVYKLYDLTFEEVKILDPEFSLTEEEYLAIKID